MIEAVTAGLSSLNAAMTLAKGLNAANTQAAINDIKLDLQERIFEAREALTIAREAQSASLEKIRQLEQKIVEFEQWEADKNSYELKRYWPGTYAYVLKPEMAGAQPLQLLCQPCFDQRKKGVLYATGDVRRGQMMFCCPRCELTISIGGEMPPDAGIVG